jgi:hypothetical protein
MNSATTLTTLRWIVQIAALRPVIQWRRCAKAWRNVIPLDHGVYAKSCANGCRCRRPYPASGSDAVNGRASRVCPIYVAATFVAGCRCREMAAR